MSAAHALTPQGGGFLRLLRVVDREGRPTGALATHGQVLAGAARQAELRLTVQDGRRSAVIRCVDCHVLVKVARRSRVPQRCREHAREQCLAQNNRRRRDLRKDPAERDRLNAQARAGYARRNSSEVA